VGEQITNEQAGRLGGACQRPGSPMSSTCMHECMLAFPTHSNPPGAVPLNQMDTSLSQHQR